MNVYKFLLAQGACNGQALRFKGLTSARAAYMKADLYDFSWASCNTEIVFKKSKEFDSLLERLRKSVAKGDCIACKDNLEKDNEDISPCEVAYALTHVSRRGGNGLKMFRRMYPSVRLIT